VKALSSSPNTTKKKKRKEKKQKNHTTLFKDLIQSYITTPEVNLYKCHHVIFDKDAKRIQWRKYTGF
jgi:hypothetical protein